MNLADTNRRGSQRPAAPQSEITPAGADRSAISKSGTRASSTHPAPPSPLPLAFSPPASESLTAMRRRAAPVLLSGQRLSGSALVRDPLSRPVSPPRAEGAAKPIIHLAESPLAEPQHRSAVRNVSDLFGRSRLSPSQRLAQTRPHRTVDRNGKDAYVTYTVKPPAPK